MIAYHGRSYKCSVVHDGVRRKLLYGTMKELIDPECHCIDQKENGQLDADQNREKILLEICQYMPFVRSA
jgi:hypothetical protein